MRGLCWLLQRCNWWNPTLDMICKGGGDYCIKCWEFRGAEKQ